MQDTTIAGAASAIALHKEQESRVLLRHLTIAILAALALAACGGSPAGQPPTAAPAGQTIAPPPTLPPAPARPTEPPTQAPPPTQLPPTQPPAATQRPPTQAPAATPAPTQPPAATASAAGSFGSEILFLRKGALTAFDTGTRKERQLATDVTDFETTPDGALIAIIRGAGRKAEVWTVRRDGSALTQITADDRAEAGLAWSSDGAALVYGSSSAEKPYSPDWMVWSGWCAGSEVHVLSVADSAVQSFGPGCDPALSPDGKRIAYATPPKSAQEGTPSGGIQNTIRLINRQGQNGWSFALADGGLADGTGKSGLLVYAPAWSPDGKQIVYHRYLGYQALVDMDLTEIAGSFDGKGKPLATGAGWLLPARFAPDGQSVAITENNVGDARGFGGYDNWSVTVASLSGSRQIALPSGPLTAVGQSADRLPRGQGAAWSPDGAALAIQLPPGWRPDLAPDQAVNADGQPGEIWRWRPGSPPGELLVKNVDFASPLAWLPAAQ
jgi:Tol biopolymer transport system component